MSLTELKERNKICSMMISMRLGSYSFQSYTTEYKKNNYESYGKITIADSTRTFHKIN